MVRLSWLPLLALGFAAGAFAAPPDSRLPATAEAMFPVYTDRSQNPTTWDGIAEALKRAGVNNAIAAIRVRQSAVWSAHVDLRPDNRRPAARAIVSFDLNVWKVLCVTSETEDCSRYGR
jgi:hypothetical protein